LKIGCVAFFSYNLGGFANSAFNIMDEILFVAIGGFSPWNQIDAILGTIFGFAPGMLLSQGLIWLGAGLTSGWSSIPMSSALIVMFIELVLFVIEICYTFLSAYLVVAFMLILSPMFIPLIIFQSSERYFKKWLDTIIGSMLVPVFLFAALSFSLMLFTDRICGVYNAILPNYTCRVPIDPNNPPDFHSFWKMNQAMMAYNTGMDTNMVLKQQNVVDRSEGDTYMLPSSHTVINPLNRGGFDFNPANMMQINFGTSDFSINQDIMLALITLWIYIALLKQLILKMPDVAQAIAGSYAGIRLTAPDMKEKFNGALSDAVGGAGVYLGGSLGGQLGAVSGSTRVTQAGAIGGGIIGNVLARKII
jgi:type IV secretion system protein VirB6